MFAVEAAHAFIHFVADRMVGDDVEATSNEMTEGVTAEDVSGKQDDVDDEHQGADADAEMAVKVEGNDGIPDEKCPDNIRKAQEIAVKVLQDQRKAALAELDAIL